jgi:hypothetical protein
MKTPIRTLPHHILLVVLVFTTACSTSRKFDYASAYKFRYHRAVEQVAEAAPAPEESSLVASAAPEAAAQADLSARMEAAEERVLAQVGLTGEEARRMGSEGLAAHVQTLSRSEKAAFKKSVKQELAAFDRNEIRAMRNYDAQAAPSDINLSGYTRTGVIVGGLGILLLILGAIFSDVLLFFGVGLVLAGVVFILIDVL